MAGNRKRPAPGGRGQEDWNNGILERWVGESTAFPSIPTFQHSIIPSIRRKPPLVGGPFVFPPTTRHSPRRTEVFLNHESHQSHEFDPFPLAAQRACGDAGLTGRRWCGRLVRMMAADQADPGTDLRFGRRN
jgi:hypothetical protein